MDAVQKLDDEKRNRILSVAAELFATRPFHKVLLNDVAVEAAVGKGTLYTYFENKEALFLAVLYSGFEKLVDRLRRCIEVDETGSPREVLETIVGELVSTDPKPALDRPAAIGSFSRGRLASMARETHGK